MFKGINLGIIVIILALSGFNGYAYLTQAYPNCDLPFLSQSETTTESSEDIEEESGGIGGLIGGLMPGGGGEGGGGIGGLIGGGGGLPGLPGGWILPHAFGQSESEDVIEESEEIIESPSQTVTTNPECDTPGMMKLVTLGLGMAGIAGIVYSYFLPIIRKKKSGSGDSKSEFNTIIEMEQEETGKGLKIFVKFKNKKNNPLYQVNYDITATLRNQPILQENDVHSKNGELTHHTVEILGEMNATNPITIEVAFKGFGINPPFSGPIGEKIIKKIPDPEKTNNDGKKIAIPKLNLKILIPLIIAGIFPVIMMSGIIPIQADETATIQEIEVPQITLADLENKMDVLELHVQSIEESINLEVPGKIGQKGVIGDRGVRGEVGKNGDIGKMFSILSFSSGSEKIRISGEIYIGENTSFPNYHAAKTFIPFKGEIKNLVVILDNVPGVLVDATIMKNNIPTNLSCKLEKNTECFNLENTVVVGIGDTLSLRLSEKEHGESDSFIVQSSVVIEIP